MFIEMGVFIIVEQAIGAPNGQYDKQSFFGCLQTVSSAFISQIAILHASVLALEG